MRERRDTRTDSEERGKRIEGESQGRREREREIKREITHEHEQWPWYAVGVQSIAQFVPE